MEITESIALIRAAAAGLARRWPGRRRCLGQKAFDLPDWPTSAD